MRTLSFITALLMSLNSYSSDTIKVKLLDTFIVPLVRQTYHQVGGHKAAVYDEYIHKFPFKALRYLTYYKGDTDTTRNGEYRTDYAHFKALQAGIHLIEIEYEYSGETMFGVNINDPHPIITYKNRTSSGSDSIYIKVLDTLPKVKKDIIIEDDIIYRCSNIYIPNVFNPESENPDNQEFRPFGVNYKDYNMRIWNRWGDLICISKDWDGDFKGVRQRGTFVYEIILTRTQEKCKGIVTVLSNETSFNPGQ